MRFTETAVAGVWVVDLEPHTDERGGFARTFAADEFAARGLETAVVHCNLSWSHRAGTVRGMHWQAAPAEEAKLVRCVRGAVHDVVVDVRPTSATHRAHVAVELSAATRRAVYIPPGCAHGFQTLVDDTEVTYQHSVAHTPGTERGLRHDDPALAIAWPLPVTVVSERDRAWPLLDIVP